MDSSEVKLLNQKKVWAHPGLFWYNKTNEVLPLDNLGDS